LREVKAEVDYQVRRLQHHACLALWCGDNELIGALTWFKESRDNRDRYLVNYDRLNRTIEDAVKAADPGGLWWPSSPSPGILDFGDTWHDDSKGDMHFWSVWHEGRDFDHYRDVKPRFCSEFGFQSFSSMNIAQGFVENEDDLNIASPVMEHHQRNAGGNARIAETMFRNFRFPMDFANFVYLSQVQHALAMRIAVESWRSLKPHCMGTLYWQLNDTWPVASWSGLDHGGTWKALHYAARRFYAPVLITVTPDGVTGDYIVSGVNDHPDAQAIDADVFACSPAGDLTRLKRVSATLEPDAAVRIAKIFQSEIPAGAMLWWSWQGRNGIRGRNHLGTVPYKSITLPRTDIQLDVTVHEGSLDITVSSSVLALYVMLECSAKGLFSDNVFDLLPGETLRVQFKPEQPSELAAAQASLVVRDLYSSSH
jgi:beta-mannosidase